MSDRSGGETREGSESREADDDEPDEGDRSDGRKEGREADGTGGEDPDGTTEDGDESDGGEVSTGERILMGLSVLFTLSLFAFAVWQVVAGPGMAAPEVRVAGSQPGEDGSVLYQVELRNPGDIGVVVATVNVRCTDPPTELVFRNVPAGGRERAVVRCPSGTTDPGVTVVSWVQE